MNMDFQEYFAAVCKQVTVRGALVNTAEGDVYYADQATAHGDFAVKVLSRNDAGNPAVMDFGFFNPEDKEFKTLGTLTSVGSVMIPKGISSSAIGQAVKQVGYQLGMHFN